LCCFSEIMLQKKWKVVQGFMLRREKENDRANPE